MKLAYVDTSCLVAIAFAEPGAAAMARRLGQFDRLISSNLLEAELRSALAREGVGAQADELLRWVNWVHPSRALTPEFDRILAAGYLKAADLWHLACALVSAPDLTELTFLTLDKRQKETASRLGFIT